MKLRKLPRLRVPRREKWFPVLPTLVTLGNAVCGFGAITFAAKVGPGTTEGSPLFVAALLVFGGMVFDMLDGHTARLTKQTSHFGAQLDSLCDVITFGVAPSFIMLRISEAYHPRLLWVIAVLYTVCAVLRLARFNVETDEQDSHDSFSGLPSPAAAGMVASFAIVMPQLKELTGESMPAMTQYIGQMLLSAVDIGLPLITLAVACLMVSRIRYPHVFNQLFRGRRNFQHIIQLIFALVVVFAVHELALPLIFGYFVLGSPIRALWTKMVAHRRADVSPQPAPEYHSPSP
ncbi:MAG: CDP-diacylglycerol--serine O-phosphatidyltransferase [Thermoguttaceae bacterium]|jgi:CDP-diacylglycerol--serine O-phosphatidyltransferase